MVHQALAEGFVLAPHFAEQLAVFEQEDRSMRLFYPDMVSSLDPKKEQRRLANVAFITEKPTRKAKAVPAERQVELTGPRKTLQDAERFYAGRDLAKAKEAYLRLLQETDEGPLRGGAYYGLARVAALEKDPELAEKLFVRALASSPDAQTSAWCHVYLGRLAGIAGETEKAAGHYRSALALEGASPKAREAAQMGLQDGFKKD